MVCSQLLERKTTSMNSSEGFSKGDFIKVICSPGAPFDINKVFTVKEIDNKFLMVQERNYWFREEWVEKSSYSVPSPSIILINGHEWLSGSCVNCGSTNSVVKCPGASI